jgi:hypothetical protein
VQLIETVFGDVVYAVVRVKPPQSGTGEGRRTTAQRHRRSWALITFSNEEYADAAIHDGMLVHDSVANKRVPLVIHPANISGELQKGHRGALGQVRI